MIVKTQLEISARHIHLTEEEAERHLLFTTPEPDEILKHLSVKGEQALKSQLHLPTNGHTGRMMSFRVLYPWRDTSYFEASAYEIHQLRKSGLNTDKLPIPIIVNPPHIHLDRRRVPGCISERLFSHGMLHFHGHYIQLQVKYNELDANVVDDDVEGVVHLDVGWAQALGVKGGEKVYVNLEV